MTEEEKLRYKSGQIARRALLSGAKLIKPGALLVDVVEHVEQKIISQGAGLAFPAQINQDNIAAHYCPVLNDTKEIKEGQIIKLDCGAHVEGYISDNAVTVDLGTGTKLKEASEACLKAAIKLCKVGTMTNEIGAAILEQAQNYGYTTIKNLSGHGIGRWEVHLNPGIPNYNPGNGSKLKEGMSIAIEPFVTNGEGLIYETEPVGVYMLAQKKGVRSQFARDALKIIEEYKGLPFALRWIEEKMGSAKARFGIKELVNAGVLRSYGPLLEKQKGLVAQTEHSVIIRNGSPLVITELE